MNDVSPFKLTPDDLDGIDRKTRDGLGPLLDALNVTMQQLVQAVNSAQSSRFVPVVLVTDAVVDDSFPIVFKHGLASRPSDVSLANILPKDPDHVLTTPFVMQGWGLTDASLVSVPAVTGLLPLNSYTLVFRVQ